MEFRNQTVIVTGAAQGIGEEVAKTFAKKGSNVILADTNEEKGKTVEVEINETGGESWFIKTDMKKEEDIIRLVEFTIQKYGKIDIVVNNAGISKFKPIFELSVQEWDQVINTNLRGIFLLSREAARFMKEKGGAIINLASTRAFMSEPNSESYAATKGGIVALTHAMAASLSEYHIRVNSISPGWIHTGKIEELSKADHKQHWSGRVGTPADIARTCLFLASPENDFITGENIVVDGGMTKKMMYVE